MHAQPARHCLCLCQQDEAWQRREGDPLLAAKAANLEVLCDLTQARTDLLSLIESTGQYLLALAGAFAAPWGGQLGEG